MAKIIKNIIFDLGGVLLNIDYDLTLQAFQKLGIKNFNQFYSQAKQSAIFSLLETGKISADIFCNEIRIIGEISSPNNDIIDAWNSMLLDFPQERFDFLKTINKRYNSFLLSNTNSIHLEALNKLILEKNNVSNLNSYFLATYYSHLVGLRKPHPEIFQHVIDDNNLNPESTLFIDDSVQHVNGAKSIGIQSVLLDTNKETVINKLSFLLT